MRPIRHRYLDPLDQIWLTTARRVGLRVRRSSEVYASTDGEGALVIGTPDTLDADDSLAQMIFHELCHSLIEGPGAFALEDWGLDNTGERHVAREHACLRLQAVLAAEHGLRRFFAPTTDFRSFYDALPDDPLWPEHDPSVVLATLAVRRADKPPWAPHLGAALAATSAIAQVTADFADPGGPALPSLWREVAPPAPRHPVGFAMSAVSSDAGRTCASCAWHYEGGRGKPVSRCRQADGARVAPEWPACDRWEPELDCQQCGACCREAYDSVTVSRREPMLRRHPELVVDRGSYVELARRTEAGDNRCAALGGGTLDDRGQLAPYGCVIYEERPRPCREFERSGPHCLTARRRVGLSR